METKAVKSLIVDHDPGNEDFIVGLSQANLKRLKFKNISHAMVKGKDEKKALCSVYTASCSDDKILMNRLVRYNLGLLLGDPVRLERTNIMYEANQIFFQPVGYQFNYNSEVLKDLLHKFVVEKSRTLCEGNRIIVRGCNVMQEVIVKRVQQYKLGITNQRTIFQVLASEEKEELKVDSLRAISYNDVAGQNDALTDIRQFECFMRSPTLFKSNNKQVSPARIILYGPEGLGKLLMAKAFANETGSYFVLIDNQVLMNNQSKKDNDISISLNMINQKVNEALNCPPSVICLNDLHLMTPAASPTQFQREFAEKLIMSMERLRHNPNVILIGITTAVSKIYDPVLSLLLESKNAAQIAFSMPDKSRRADILRYCTKNINLENPSIIDSVAALTEGYTTAKLEKLCKIAYACCNNNALKMFDNNDKTDLDLVLYKTALSMANFTAAVKDMLPKPK